MRVDFNVPTEERDGEIVITDDTRMQESLPTIQYLREQGARTILMAHFGRPKGKPVEKYSLRPVGMALHNLIDHPVAFSHDCIGADAEEIVARHERRRRHAARKRPLSRRKKKRTIRNSPKRSRSLSDGLYVNDAFGAAHRAHASTAGITKFVRQAAMGFLMEKELKYLHEELAQPARPFLVIMGGGKVSDKIGVIKALHGKSRHVSDLRRDGEHLFQSAGHPRRREPGGSRQTRSRARAARAREGRKA